MYDMLVTCFVELQVDLMICSRRNLKQWKGRLMQVVGACHGAAAGATDQSSLLYYYRLNFVK